MTDKSTEIAGKRGWYLVRTRTGMAIEYLGPGLDEDVRAPIGPFSVDLGYVERALAQAPSDDPIGHGFGWLLTTYVTVE